MTTQTVHARMGQGTQSFDDQPISIAARTTSVDSFGLGRASHFWELLILALGLASCSDGSSKTSPTTSTDAGVDAAVAPTVDSLPFTSTSATNPAATSNGSKPTTPTATDAANPSMRPTSSPTTGAATSSTLASIKAQLSTPKTQALELSAFRAGSASAANVDSLKYFIRSIQVCEDLQPQGSGFQNPSECLELYNGSQTTLQVDPSSDFTTLGDAARTVTDGYVDLLSSSERETLTRSTVLQPFHVRTYNYGIITWALPVKVTATVKLGDGTNLFTHDGVTTSNLIGEDNFRDYFTRSAVSLLTPPAEEAVVLLGNGGNWFKFQQGFEITQDDLDEGRDWVLDLVFNPDGIIKGYEGTYVGGNLREEDNEGAPSRGITVPMLDLVPVPHRESDHVVRESYVANVDLNGNSFDLRLELYSRENDDTHSVLGVDVKTLVNEATTEPPPEASKVATVRTDDTGLRFGSFNDSQIIGEFSRLNNVGDTTRATIACATHADRVGAEGGALIVVSACHAPSVEVEFTLRSRARLNQSGLPTVDVDAGAQDTPEPGDASVPNDAAPTDVPEGGTTNDARAPEWDAAPMQDAAAFERFDAGDAAL